MKDTMENRIMFLAKRKYALERFFYNCRKFGNDQTPINFLDPSKTSNSAFLKGSFPWELAEESSSYWAHLHAEYTAMTSENSEKITDSDIATIEALHDLLIDNHGYSTEFNPIKNARELTDKMHRILRKDQ